MKGVVREPALHGTSTPAGAKVHVVVSGPEGESVADQDGVVSSFGTFAFDVKVPPAGRLGSYGIIARLGARDTGGLHGSFEVAEYRPAEFKVSAEPVPAKGARPGTYVRGDQAAWTIAGEFLFGAPMAKAEARYTVSRSPASFEPPLPAGFISSERSFTEGLSEASPRSSVIANGRAVLDDHGHSRSRRPLTLPGQTDPEQVVCDAEVTDLSRQSFAGRSLRFWFTPPNFTWG